MDKVHRADEQQFVSKVISLRQFYEEALAATGQIVSVAENFESFFAKKTGCSREIIAELQSVCDPQNLKCGLEDEDDPFSPIIPDTDLETLKTQKNELAKRSADLQYRQAFGQNLKYKRYNFPVIDLHKRSGSGGLTYRPPDVLLTVVLMKPYNRPLYQHETRLGRLLKMDAVFAVRGNQDLTSLRDQIQCLSDFAYSEDFSENPRGCDEGNISSALYPSSFFYINGTFYNDFRQPGSHDISRPIREWAKKRPGDIGAFEVKNMEQTTFMDLKIRLGQPYLYQHQGSCEHLLVFSDLRLLHQNDAQDFEDYPLQISAKMKKRVCCNACKIYNAKWAVYNNKLLSFHPAFFCDVCYRSFHYDDNGEKKMEFQAVPYFDRNALN